MNCIFCKIINKELPAEIVYEDDDILAFRDINPKARIHVLVIPKKHISSVSEMEEEDISLIGKCLHRAKLIAEQKKIGQSGYKLVINAGEDGGQLVPHLHIHLLGGEKLSGENLV